MKKIALVFILLFLFHFQNCQSAEKETDSSQIEGLTAEDKMAISAVRKFINYVRYSKKSPAIADKAIDIIDLDYVCNYLINNNLDKLAPAEKTEYKSLIAEHVKLKAFPTALKYFEKIDLVYNKPVVRGNEIVIPSTLIYKGTDRVQFSWVVTKSGFKLIDLLNENGISSMKENRDKQILPFYQKKGIKGLNEKLREINAALAKQT